MQHDFAVDRLKQDGVQVRQEPMGEFPGRSITWACYCGWVTASDRQETPGWCSFCYLFPCRD